MSRTGTPKWVLTAALIFSIFVILFTIAESLARLTGHVPYTALGPKIEIRPKGSFFLKDELLGYRNKPGKFTITQNDHLVFSATHNSKGQRITSMQDHEGRPGCWIFGCSFTYGWGVNDRESFPWLLQEDMAHLRIENFGVGGYGNFQNLLQFENEIANAKTPVCVILAYAPFHDERNVMAQNYANVLARFNKLGPLSMPFARFDKNGILDRRSTVPLQFNTWPCAHRSAFMNAMQQEWIRYKDRKLNGPMVSQALIREFKSVCDTHRITFILAYIGSPGKFNTISEQYKHSGIEIVDISVDLSQEWASLLPLDPHPSARTHRIYADRLKAVIERIQFVDDPPNDQ